MVFVLLISTIILFVRSTDDKFIKRYAVMKMYESCFGSEVVREVRKEMKMANAKCNGMAQSGIYPSNIGGNILKNPIALIIQSNKHQNDNLYSPEHLKSQTSSNIDLNKLQQAIFTGFNKAIFQHTPYSNNVAVSGTSAPGYTPLRTWTYPVQPNVLPYSHLSGLPPNQPVNPAFMSPTFSYPMSPLYQSLFFSPHYGTGRSSKDLDIKGQFESLAVRVSGKMKNVTCIMQELGYLNENLEPDYEKIINRIKKLSIANELKSEMIDGVQYCKQFSSCVPDDSKDKLSREMVKPIFFFRCYKHKKMEACIMKDIKDRYSNDESDYNVIGIERNDRSSQELNSNDVTELSLYEFLFGNGDIDLEFS
ncbi:hypothetical protein PGB90_001287 [Kerria lacca]